MNDNELVSIIIPAYNVEKYIEKCIYSALNQTYKYKEIIVINDGSKDNTLGIIKNISKKHKEIIVIDKNNTGVSDTRNFGIKKSNGKYITFFDADDYVDVNFIEDGINLIKKYNLDLVNTGFYSETHHNNKINVSYISYNDKLYQSKKELIDDLVRLFDASMLYNIWNKIYLKDIICKNNIEFSNISYGEDVEFNKKYISYINRFYNSSKCYYHYIREREGAITKNFKKDIFDIRKKEFIEYNNYFNGYNLEKSDYYEYSCRRYIERILGCIENIFNSNYNLKTIYKEVKLYINDPYTREALVYAKPKTKKVVIMLVPIRLKMVLLTMLMGKILNVVKKYFPDIFNNLKNRR